MLRFQIVLGVAACFGLMLPFGAQSRDNTPVGGTLLVANKGDHSLGLIDPAAGKQIADFPEGGVTGHEVIASPDGRTAYVPIYGNSGVDKPGTDGTHLVVVDLATKAFTGQVDFGKG